MTASASTNAPAATNAVTLAQLALLVFAAVNAQFSTQRPMQRPLFTLPLIALATTVVHTHCATTASTARPVPAANRNTMPARLQRPMVVTVPGGTFVMGSPDTEPFRDGDEGPPLPLTIASFAMDVTPVTVAQFSLAASVIEASTPDDRWQTEAQTPANWLAKCNLGSSRTSHPMNCVSWLAARTYCQLLQGDLPTEAQWEYAARATTTQAYWWGESFDPVHAVSSVQCGSRGCRGGTEPVTTSGPRCNGWGLCDIVGNVWQWTLTDYREQLQDYVAHPPDVLQGVAAHPVHPVHRGGAWLDDRPGLFRSAHRGLNYVNHGRTGVGFRCVYPAPTP